MQKSEDLRVKRTRKMLRDALVELIDEKGFESITVTDLAERAMINRATFYRHYRDKEDLFERCIDETVEELARVAESVIYELRDRATLADALYYILLADFKYLAENADFGRVMLGRDVPAAVSARIRDYLMKLGKHHAELFDLPIDQGRMPYDVSLSFSAAGYIGAMSWWLENEMPYSPEEMARSVSFVAIHGVYAARNWELQMEQ
jgi:AcrR family transcriptional regulator